MTTRTELLSGLRLRVNDLTGNRWPNDELIAYLVDAARDYSKYFPRKRELEFEVDGVLQRYDVPTDLIDDQIHSVTILGTNTKEVIPHRQIGLPRSSRFFEVIDHEIVFGYVPLIGGNAVIRYNAVHTMPDTGATSIPSEDEDLIYAYAMAAAWQRIAGNDAGLSRWTEDQKRDDSPLIPHYIRLWERYNRLIAQKLGQPRTYRRVRAQGNWRR